MGRRDRIFLGMFLFLCSATFAAEGATRPGAESGQPTPIYVGAALLDLEDVDEDEGQMMASVFFLLRWQDDRLAHDNDGIISVDPDEIWTPTMLIANQRTMRSRFQDRYSVHPDGTVEYRFHRWGAFSQVLRLRDFPLDAQKLIIHLVTPGNDGEEYVLLPSPEDPAVMGDQFSVADWTVTGWYGESRPFVLSGGAKVEGFAFLCDVKRRIGSILIRTILPLSMIVVISWVVFWIDPAEASSQLGVSVTCFLTVIAFHIALTNSLPDISYATRMDIFVFGSTTLVAAGLIEVVATSRFASRDKRKLAIGLDRVSRIGFPLAFALLLLASFRL